MYNYINIICKNIRKCVNCVIKYCIQKCKTHINQHKYEIYKKNILYDFTLFNTPKRFFLITFENFNSLYISKLKKK